MSAIADQGPRGFYEGPVAEKLAKAIRDAGGIMTAGRSQILSAVIRTPVRGSYRGYDIVSMPLPSSGGVVLLETLNILEGFPLRDMEQGSAASLHVMIEAMKRGYADRARYLGDPAFVNAPIATLISKDYAAKQRASIDLDRATPWTDALSATPPHEGSNTTHFSVVDGFGNAVSNTYTLNFSYGVGLVAEGTGVLLNNELDDFTAAPGASNAFGLVGFEANLPGPGKRPLSSMSPTIVLKDGRPVLVTGSPGGSRIISTVLQVIVNVLDYDMDVAAAVAAPRLHHQWLPDEVKVERGFSDEVLAELKAKGHRIVESMGYSSANSIFVTPNGLLGAPDPRTRGAEAAGIDRFTGGPWVLRKWIAVGVVLAALAASAIIFRPDRALRVATGYVAHNICSKTFVSGFDPQTVFAETIDATAFAACACCFAIISIARQKSSMHRWRGCSQAARRFTRDLAASCCSAPSNPILSEATSRR